MNHSYKRMQIYPLIPYLLDNSERPTALLGGSASRKRVAAVSRRSCRSLLVPADRA